MGNSFGAEGMKSVGNGIGSFGNNFQLGMRDASWNLKSGFENGMENGSKHIRYGFENGLSNASANLEHGMIGAAFELSNGMVDVGRRLEFGMTNSAHELTYGMTEASRELRYGAERSALELSHGMKDAAEELRSGMKNFGHELRRGTVDAAKLFSNNMRQSLVLLVKCVIVIAVLLVASNFLTIYMLTAETTSSTYDPWVISQLIQNSEKIEKKVEENRDMVIYAMCIFFGIFVILHLIMMNGWNRMIRFFNNRQFEREAEPTFTKKDDLAAAVAAAILAQNQNQHRFVKKRPVFAK